MKLKHFGIFLLISAVALFSACGDDDDDKGGDVVDLATEVKGDYKGELVVVVGDAETEPTENSISLVRTDNNKVNIELKGFSFSVFGPYNIKLTGIELEGETGNVKIKENKDQAITLGEGTAVINAKVTTNGAIKGEKINLTLNVSALVGGAEELPITVTFDGALVK